MEIINAVQYFDGLQSTPQSALLYISAEGFSLQVGSVWDACAPVLFFPKGECSFQKTNHQLIVFLNKKSGAYFTIGINESIAKEVIHLLQSAEKSIAASLFKLNVFTLLLLVVLLFSGVYWGISTIVPWAGLKIIKPETETELGEKMYESMMGGVSIDKRKTALVQDFANSLELSKTYPIKITVVKNPEVNAYAMPGGNIVVYSGILRTVQSGDELAALLGHEAAHINERHSLRSVLRSAATGLMISVIFNDVSGILSILVENAEGLRSMQFSRSMEENADEVGMKMLVKNKINPLAMKQLMQTLKDNAPDMPTVLSFMSTHPATDDRIKHAESFAIPYKNSSFAANPLRDSIWRELK